TDYLGLYWYRNHVDGYRPVTDRAFNGDVLYWSNFNWYFEYHCIFSCSRTGRDRIYRPGGYFINKYRFFRSSSRCFSWWLFGGYIYSSDSCFSVWYFNDHLQCNLA